MWKSMIRIVNVAELRATVLWFGLSAVLQGVTLALMIPFLQALLGRTDDALTWLVVITVMGIAVVIVDAYAMFRSYRISVYEICDAVIDRVANHVLRLPLGWFTAKREAAVANALSTHVNTMSHTASIVIPNLLNAFVTPLVMLIATLFIDWRLSLVMAAAIVPLILVWRIASASVTRANEMSGRSSEKAAGRLIEFARLQQVLRATGVGADWQPVHDAIADDAEATLNGLRIVGRPAQGYSLIVNITFAVVVAAGWSFVAGYQLDAVAYLVLIAVVARMLLPLTQTAMFQGEANKSRVALDDVANILDADPLVEPSPDQAKTPIGADIEFKDVSFAYEDSHPVLDSISLLALQGTVTAIVGPSGAGKTTILRLAARFWDVDAGQVLIGGADVRDIGSVAIMDQVAMVFQDVYLFDETIRENLRVARPGATDEELEIAARRARLDQAIEALPDGWDTNVGPAGKSLSGGERQRVAIARAFIKDAPILLLDEITSALDGENESAISHVVAELAAGRTVIVVAHRLSTIRDAQQVIVLAPAETGATIVQRGTPAELESQPGQFRDMVEALNATQRWQITTAG